MNTKFFTVGPTQLHPDYIQMYSDAIAKNFFSHSHRTEEFQKIYETSTKNLKLLLNIPHNFYIFFLSSATECMERILQNLVINKSFHFINGYFAKRFYDFALMLKKSPYHFTNDFKSGFDLNQINIPNDTELIAVTHNETGTGIAIQKDFIYKLKNKYPDKILAVDMVTSLPHYDFDFNYIDTAFFSIQKGFALPPGLGVLLVKKELLNKTQELYSMNLNIGTYNNFLRLAENADKSQTTMTPNIPAIYMLGEVCKKYLETGIENIRSETTKKAALLYNFFDKHSTIKPYIEDKNIRSETTINLQIDNPELIKKITDKLEYNGFYISNGYADLKNSQLRIGNFPVHKPEDVSELIYLFRKF